MSAQSRYNAEGIVGGPTVARPLLGGYSRLALRRADGIQREHGLVPTQARDDAGGGIGGAAGVLEIRSADGGGRRHV